MFNEISGMTIFGAHCMLKVPSFLCCLPVHGSAFNGDRSAACCEAPTNFAGESACLIADKVWNERK
jgi:hypothetical protein